MAEIIQGSAEWHAIRLGKVTASRIADVIAKTKSGPSASRANYAAQLIAERLTGEATEGFTNAAMQWGTDKEPAARAAYAFYRDAEVSEIAFVDHPNIGMSGASPDGLVGLDGLVEFKCPNTATHIETLLGAPIPDRYRVQMLWQMECTGRAFCDFVSFDPRMPEEMRLSVQRVERDESRLAEIRSEVSNFLAEIETKVDRLRQRYGMSVAV